MPEATLIEWDQFIARAPDAHILQVSAWGELKTAFGWQAIRVIQGECGAQIHFRRLPFGFSMAYLPKGPIGPAEVWDSLWTDVDLICRRERVILLLVEPNLFLDEILSSAQYPPVGFSPGIQNIQPPRTIVVNLVGEESEVLNRMKQKTRYNIRLAQKRGIEVQASQDIKLFHQLMKKTGERDGFGVHSYDYYQKAYDLFYPLGKCEVFIAYFQGEPLAALMAFAHGRSAWYFYGASTDQYREYMPTYLLQFEAMRWARAQGCQCYDLWGVPDLDEAILEREFLQHKEGLWGVYRFKRGFGGDVRRAIDPWQRIYQPALYPLYRWWVQKRKVD
jgi:lipid II:glycine glycyltransferase (peptidoglycan interpeptide bridge formation enzyme)